MQLLLIRHALPERILTADSPAGADPGLTPEGHAQAARLPEALAAYPISAIVSSPQRRARETAAPLATARGLPVTADPDLAEYDYGRSDYVPIHEAKQIAPEAYARILAGYLPDFVDASAFRSRVLNGIDRVIAAADHDDTVAVVAHGGVVNVYLQHLLGLDRPLTFPVDYASVTRILVSRNGNARPASVNETGHVRDLLPRHR
ncbi:histidine phosphatase family protein [Rhodococcus spelaei]|uniref:Histidine phosphatase family protein n=1 Tax=Rhodococcus spelaei TaxID=2546320 RepID=A0A541BQX1_9NOCA|nr:histidine phosphatase family protein [Rhodococcus spelaei]TQF74732.1 histidine phosphatase family protein [Rhodococcus spelaei]